jgi:hypothetical protein
MKPNIIVTMVVPTVEKFERIYSIAACYGFSLPPRSDEKTIREYAKGLMANSWARALLRGDSMEIDACKKGYRINPVVYVDWDENPGKLLDVLENQFKTPKKVELNQNYTAIVHDDTVEVGCQTFSKEKVRELYKACFKE